jgi:hypothetical protein
MMNLQSLVGCFFCIELVTQLVYMRFSVVNCPIYLFQEREPQFEIDIRRVKGLEVKKKNAGGWKLSLSCCGRSSLWGLGNI